MLISLVLSLILVCSNVSEALQIPISYQNTDLVVSLKLGTPPQNIRVKLNTINSDSWVYQDTNSFDAKRSSSFVTTNHSYTIHYQQQILTGVMVSDYSYFSDKSSIFSYFGLFNKNKYNNDSVDGELGVNLFNQYNLNVNWITQYNQQNQQNQTNMSTLGLYINRKHPILTVNNPEPLDKMTWFNDKTTLHQSDVYLASGSYLTIPVATISNQPDSIASITDTSNYFTTAKLDISSDVIAIPELIYLNLVIDILKESTNCLLTNDHDKVVCHNNFQCQNLPTLYLISKNSNNQTVQNKIIPSSYVKTLSDNGCELLLRPVNDNTWILGKPFLENYYLELNLDPKYKHFTLTEVETNKETSTPIMVYIFMGGSVLGLGVWLCHLVVTKIKECRNQDNEILIINDENNDNTNYQNL